MTDVTALEWTLADLAAYMGPNVAVGTLFAVLGEPEPEPEPEPVEVTPMAVERATHFAGLYGLIDQLPRKWTPEHRSRFLDAFVLVLDLSVKVDEGAPTSPEMSGADTTADT